MMSRGAAKRECRGSTIDNRVRRRQRGLRRFINRAPGAGADGAIEVADVPARLGVDHAAKRSGRRIEGRSFPAVRMRVRQHLRSRLGIGGPPLVAREEKVDIVGAVQR